MPGLARVVVLNCTLFAWPCLVAGQPLEHRSAVSPGPPAPSRNVSRIEPRASREQSRPAAVNPGGGIVYTCDPTITALSPTLCNTLNTTIADLYAATFSNISASIYIQ